MAALPPATSLFDVKLIPQQDDVANQQQDDVANQIHDDFIKCPTCHEVLKAPKMLPCLHTYCLSCLETMANDSKKKGTVQCLVCNKQHAIKPTDIAGLPTNAVAIKQVELHEIFSIGKNATCDEKAVCEGEEQAIAYCTYCARKMCTLCTRVHRKSPALKWHLILQEELADDKKIQNGLNMLKARLAHCQLHREPERFIEHFCTNCSKPICDTCSRLPEHNGHNFVEITKEAESCSMMLSENRRAGSMKISTLDKLLKKLEADEQAFVKQTDDVEKAINLKAKAIKRLVDSHARVLVDEARARKQAVLDKNKAPKQQIETNLAEMKHVMKVTEQLVVNGTNADIAGMSGIMDARWKELETVEVKTKATSIQFEASFDENSLKCSGSNIVGKLSFTETETSDLYRSKPMLLKTIDGTVNVSGLASLDNQLYVVRQKSAVIDVFDISDWRRERQVTVKELRDPNDITVDKQKNLYIGDYTGFVLKINTAGDVLMRWTVSGEPRRLSFTVDDSLMVTCGGIQQIVVCTDRGAVQQMIKLPSDVVTALCAIQLTANHFIVSHGVKQNETVHRVCLVDRKGVVVKTYGGQTGSGAGKLACPVQCVLDGAGCILVVDAVNDRVVLLDGKLKLVRDLVDRAQHGLIHPRRILLDEQRQQLVVGRVDGKIMVFGLG